MKQPDFRSNYRGSAATAKHVAEQIEERWPGESKRYDPFTNCLSLRAWGSQGYRVRRGEKSLRSITMIEKKDSEGQVVKRYPKTVHLFFDLQVDKINS